MAFVEAANAAGLGGFLGGLRVDIVRFWPDSRTMASKRYRKTTHNVSQQRDSDLASQRERIRNLPLFIHPSPATKFDQSYGIPARSAPLLKEDGSRATVETAGLRKVKVTDNLAGSASS